MGREREEHPSSLAAEVHADIVWLQALRKLGKARLRTWGSNANDLTDWDYTAFLAVDLQMFEWQPAKLADTETAPYGGIVGCVLR